MQSFHNARPSESISPHSGGRGGCPDDCSDNPIWAFWVSWHVTWVAQCHANLSTSISIHNLLREAKFAACFINDILVFSKDAVEHKHHVETILQILRDNHLSINPGKCNFGQQEVTFLDLLFKQKRFYSTSWQNENHCMIPKIWGHHGPRTLPRHGQLLPTLHSFSNTDRSCIKRTVEECQEKRQNQD